MVTVLLLASAVLAAAPAGTTATPNWAALTAEARQVLTHYLQMDTTNPPGNEAPAAEYLADVLRRHGIAAQIIPIAPHRAAVYARLPGSTARKGLLLLSHMDVVPADPQHWTMPPFGALVKGGEMYARGAVDTKPLGVEELFALIALHATGQALARDVVFLATPDEEAGGQQGAGWIVSHRPDLIHNVGFVINEGGGVEQDGKHVVVSIETTQKAPFWLRLTAVDRPSHASVPAAAYSTTRLLDALHRIRALTFPPRVLPQTRAYFEALASEQHDPELRHDFHHLDEAINQPRFWSALHRSPYFGTLNSLLRSTVAITRLTGSNKINVIAPEVSAELDCRLLPTDDPEAFLARLVQAVNDPEHIQFRQLMLFHPSQSPTDSPLYRTIAAVMQQVHPGARIEPTLETGFTDSHYFRELGIAAYGWDAIIHTPEQGAGVHGNDERLTLTAFDAALPVFYDVVARMTR
ncbi:MAG: M20/M25/M40 family metallo-hydrolase [Terriglobales bacterium]